MGWLRTTLGVFLAGGLLAGESDLLPDLIVRPAELYDHIVIVPAPGQKLLRFSNGTANAGAGKVHLYGVLPANLDGTQLVRQRVFRSDGTFFDRGAGLFVYHPGHSHIHVEDWCHYRLREVLAEDGVGPVVRAGEKVSFCILDLAVYDRRLPNFRPQPEFNSCQSRVQGLSVGWIDIYSRNLEGQSIEIAGVPDGFYWLESEVDPDDHVLEEDETNNVTRIKITIGNPPRAPDRYEPNDSADAVDERSAGGTNSPNLGPCNPKRVVTSLSINERGDEDYFKFYSNDTGGPRHFVRIDFDRFQGDLGIALLDASLRQLALANGSGDMEILPLTGLEAGWYFVRVFGSGGAIHPEYMLTVVPPKNLPPSVRVLAPPAGDIRILHGADIYPVTWEHFDPEGRPAWVSVYLNTRPVRDGNEILLPTTLFTEAELGLASINSSEFPPGTYWVHCEITDGGAATGAWSEGTITYLDVEEECRTNPGSEDDCNGNSVKDDCEIALGLEKDCNLNGAPDECDLSGGGSKDQDQNQVPDECQTSSTPFHRGDSNASGSTDLADAIGIFSFLFLGEDAISCKESADADNSAAIDLADGILLLNWLFGGGPEPAPPGPPTAGPCGFDPDPPGSPGDLGCDVYGECG